MGIATDGKKKHAFAKLLGRLTISSSKRTERGQSASGDDGSACTKAQGVLSGRLPYDLLLVLIEHLVASESWKTLAHIGQTSKTNYDIITPYLHQTRTLNTGSLTFETILNDESPVPIEVLATRVREEGRYFTQRAWAIRQKVNLRWTKHLLVDRILPPPTKSTVVYNNLKRPWAVDTVTILPSIMDNLSQSFPLSISTDLLRPLSQAFLPTTLILRQNTSEGTSKHLIHLLDEVRWPALANLEVHGVGADVLPGRPALKSTITFRAEIPSQWEMGLSVPLERRIRRYEQLRLSQLVLGISRSIRTRDGPDAMGDTRWTFIGTMRLCEDSQAIEESTERLQLGVREWAEREYSEAGWSSDGVAELVGRIHFVT